MHQNSSDSLADALRKIARRKGAGMGGRSHHMREQRDPDPAIIPFPGRPEPIPAREHAIEGREITAMLLPILAIVAIIAEAMKPYL